MKEINKILQFYEEREHLMLRSAIATVIHIEGSSFRRIGARMLIYEDGIWTGGISGGCLEGDVLKQAQKSIFTGKNKVITYDTRDGDPHQIGIGLGCRGKIDILVEPLSNLHIKRLKNISKHREKTYLIQVIHSEIEDLPLGAKYSEMPSKLLDLIPEVEADLKDSLEASLSSLSEYETPKGRVKILFEIFPETINLFVVGSNYDIHSLVSICDLMGWEVNLLSDYKKLPKETVSLCRNSLIGGNIEEVPDHLINQKTCLVLMSHDFETDLKVLKKNIHKPIPYIGILGPASRKQDLIGKLKSENHFNKNVDLDKIHAPIGLDLGADTPDTIALSICSEILAFFNRRNAGFLKNRDGKIYNPYPIKAVQQ